MSSIYIRKRTAWMPIALHWIMVLLIVAVYATMLVRRNYPTGTAIREGLEGVHFTLGFVVLALVIVRLLVHLRRRTRSLSPKLVAWLVLMAQLPQRALYAFMLAMPLAGWVVLSASGKAILFFGLEIPPLVAPDNNLADQVKAWHKTAGSLGYGLISLHALSALFHHYVLKDDALRRMLPGQG